MENQLTKLQERKEVVANIVGQFRATEEQNANLQRHVQLMRKEQRLREVEQQIAHYKSQLREEELEEANLLREKQQQEGNSRRQLRDTEQQLEKNPVCLYGISIGNRMDVSILRDLLVQKMC